MHATPKADEVALVPARRPSDARQCRTILATASRTFSLASALLPPGSRRATAAFYAFCRVADDAVDLSPRPADGVDHVRGMIDRAYRGRPEGDPVERELSWLVERHELPRVALDALAEGFAWDVELRRYTSFDRLLQYCARVASTVGVAMSVILGRREHHVLARASELGLALQLVNIVRDVGEDLERGRVYLPLDWLEDAGIDPDILLRDKSFVPELGAVVERLLSAADKLADRAWPGISALPMLARPAVRAAARWYLAIGDEVRRNGHDSVTTRAFVPTRRKLRILATSPFLRRPHEALEGPAPEATRFLVEACAR